jgi:hypothetical protein
LIGKGIEQEGTGQLQEEMMEWNEKIYWIPAARNLLENLLDSSS